MINSNLVGTPKFSQIQHSCGSTARDVKAQEIRVRLGLTCPESALVGLATFSMNAGLGTDMRGSIVICGRQRSLNTPSANTELQGDACVNQDTLDALTRTIEIGLHETLLFGNTTVAVVDMVPSPGRARPPGYDSVHKTTAQNQQILCDALSVHSQQIESAAVEQLAQGVEHSIRQRGPTVASNVIVQLQVTATSASWEHDTRQSTSYLLAQASAIARRLSCRFEDGPKLNAATRFHVEVQLMQACVSCGTAHEIPYRMPADILVRGIARSGRAPLISVTLARECQVAVFPLVACDAGEIPGFISRLLHHGVTVSKVEGVLRRHLTDTTATTAQESMASQGYSDCTFLSCETVNQLFDTGDSSASTHHTGSQSRMSLSRKPGCAQITPSTYAVIAPCPDSLFAAAFDPLPLMTAAAIPVDRCAFPISNQSIAARMNRFTEEVPSLVDQSILNAFCIDVRSIDAFDDQLISLHAMICKRLASETDCQAEWSLLSPSVIGPAAPLSQAAAAIDRRTRILL